MPVSAIAVNTVVNRQLPVAKDLSATNNSHYTGLKNPILTHLSRLTNCIARPLQDLRQLKMNSPLQRFTVKAADRDPDTERQYQKAEQYRLAHALAKADEIKREIRLQQDANERKHLEAERAQLFEQAQEALENSRIHQKRADYFSKNGPR